MKWIKITNCSYYIGNGRGGQKIRKNQNITRCISNRMFRWTDKELLDYYYYDSYFKPSSTSKIIREENTERFWNHDIGAPRRKAKEIKIINDYISSTQWEINRLTNRLEVLNTRLENIK